MKKNSLCCYLIAIAGTLLIPACGGGGGGEGNNNVLTPQQFESGVAGLALANFDTMTIWSFGKFSGAVNSKGEANNWEVPQIWDRDDSVNKDLGGWGTAGESTERTNILTGVIRIGKHSIGVSSMVYSITESKLYGHIKMALNQDDLRSDENSQALANFLGLTTTGQQETYTGNMLGSLFTFNQNAGTERVIIGTTTGCSLEIWINFNTNKAILQCETIVVHKIGEDDYDDPHVGAYLTSKELNYNKLEN